MSDSASPLARLARSPDLRREFLRRLANVLMVSSTVGLAVIYLPFFAALLRPWVAGGSSNHSYQAATIDRSIATSAPQSKPSQPTNLPNQPTLVIPRLAISVPVVADVDGTDQYTYNTALKRGVGQMKGTAAIEATAGNTFIFGHSSRFAVSGTPYDTVFATLSTLVVGDAVQLATPTGIQQFRVVSSRSTGPNDTSVTAPTEHRTVTLETCWPLGTTAKRWVVQAEAI